MNKKAQQDFGEIIKLIFALVVIIPILGAMFSLINSLNPKCPECDYSPYQNGLNNCTTLLQSCNKQLNETPIRYIENITYIEIPIEKPVYREKFVPISLNILAFIFSLTITIKLFKIKLPKELEERLKRIEKAIVFVKWGSFLVSLFVLIRLSYIFFSLF